MPCVGALSLTFAFSFVISHVFKFPFLVPKRKVLRIEPGDLMKLHPASLENYRVTGMSLTERRAIYHHIRSCGETWTKNKSDEMT